MLTTAMLTKLADLRGGRRVAFFIATNRLTALDAAVTRPGRFDLQLFVGTPNLPARMGRLRARLDVVGDGAAQQGEPLVRAFEAVLQRRWTANARYLTFLETEKLYSAKVVSPAQAILVREAAKMVCEADEVPLRGCMTKVHAEQPLMGCCARPHLRRERPGVQARWGCKKVFFSIPF